MVQTPQPTKRRSRFDHPTIYILTVVALLATGAGVCGYLIYTRPVPGGEPQRPAGRLVRYFEAEKSPHRVAISAFGTTRASDQWTAIAEVAGRAIRVDPRFEPGDVLPADTELVSIDPTDHQLAAARYEAEVRAKGKQLDELQQTEQNLREVLKLQERQLSLAEAEHQRQREVFAQRAVSRSALEAAENAYVTALTAVQKTRNSLALLPVQSELLRAAEDVAKVQLEQARRNLSKCEIRLPFAARCASKSVEDGQYIAAGERLGTFLDLRTAEVVAMVETRKMTSLFPRGIKELGALDFARMGVDKSLWKRFPIPVEVRWGMDERRWTWPGRIARIASSLDPGTRTLPVIVEVPNPYKDVVPGVRPPLVPDVFCRVTIYGATLEGVVVIPRDALHDDRVYLLREGKLHIQPVTVSAREEELVVIAAGIEAGDRVILTDLSPASEGMPLEGLSDDNPVKPRLAIDFPEELFDQEDSPAETDSSGRPPAGPSQGDPPAGRPSKSLPSAEEAT